VAFLAMEQTVKPVSDSACDWNFDKPQVKVLKVSR